MIYLILIRRDAIYLAYFTFVKNFVLNGEKLFTGSRQKILVYFTLIRKFCLQILQTNHMNNLFVGRKKYLRCVRNNNFQYHHSWRKNIYIYKYINIYTFLQVYIYVYIYIYIRACVYTNMCIHVCKCIYIYIYICMCGNFWELMQTIS